MTQQNLQLLSEPLLLERLCGLVKQDRATTASMLRYIAEIDRRRLYLKHACPSMFAFCVERFHMSEAIASKRIRAGRAACCFPRIFEMIERGDLHLTAVHQLAKYLTEDNHEEILQRAKHKTMREIEQLIAEIAPRPDVPSRVVALPRVTPLSPRRYKVQVTVSQETRDKLTQAQELMSHQIPDGDPAEILDKALDALLEKARKQKAALTDKPRKSSRRSEHKTRAIPAEVRREVFKRDEGQCRYVGNQGRRCGSKRFIEYHHTTPYALGGAHNAGNIELRCHAHNQYEADLEYGEFFMTTKRRGKRLHEAQPSS